jgi:NAD(P)-dependent dehydrogenase (short-subunit alcohol dehydrogenase family)
VSAASVFGQMGSPGVTAYCASKAAVIGLTRAAAKENPLIRLNCVAPGQQYFSSFSIVVFVSFSTFSVTKDSFFLVRKKGSRLILIVKVLLTLRCLLVRILRMSSVVCK